MNIKTFFEKTTQESYITFIDRVVNYMVNEYRCNTMTAKETIIRAIAERWHTRSYSMMAYIEMHLKMSWNLC